MHYILGYQKRKYFIACEGKCTLKVHHEEKTKMFVFDANDSIESCLLTITSKFGATGDGWILKLFGRESFFLPQDKFSHLILSCDKRPPEAILTKPEIPFDSDGRLSVEMP